jgi:hypothetical protein
VGSACQREEGKGNGTGSVNSRGGPWVFSGTGPKGFPRGPFIYFSSFLLFCFLVFLFPL